MIDLGGIYVACFNDNQYLKPRGVQVSHNKNMSLLSSILKPFQWLIKTISAGVKAEAPIAVTITEAVKTILANPVAGFMENIIDSVTGTNLATTVANDVVAVVPKILAAELAIEGIPANPTQSDLLAFELRVMAAFNVNSDNSRLYTVLAAQVYGIVNATATSGKPITFAVLVADVETAYSDYQADLAANAPVLNPIPAPVQPSNNASTLLNSGIPQTSVSANALSAVPTGNTVEQPAANS